MSQQYRLIIHCDEQATGDCRGFVEYASPDRLDLARRSDEHQAGAGWLRGYSAKGTYDVCPTCRPTVERRLNEKGPPSA